MKLVDILQVLLGLELMEQEGKDYHRMTGDATKRCEPRIALAREALRQAELANLTEVHVSGVATPDDAVYPTLQPGEVRYGGPEVFSSPASMLQLEVQKLEARLNIEKMNHTEDHSIAHNLAFDALVALSGAGIGTPEKGYYHEPGCLARDITRLARERDEARKKLEEGYEGHHITGTAYRCNNETGEREELVMVRIDGESYSKVHRMNEKLPVGNDC